MVRELGEVDLLRNRTACLLSVGCPLIKENFWKIVLRYSELLLPLANREIRRDW